MDRRDFIKKQSKSQYKLPYLQEKGRDYAFRDVYLLTTAADDDEQTPKRAETGLTGWIACYPESRLAGTVFCGGVNEPHAIEGNPKLQEAFELGKNV